MTYAQIRETLSKIARSGDDGIATDAIGRQRLVMLRGALCVVYIGNDCWTLTQLGWRVLEERHMPQRRPDHRPGQRRQPRRTPSVGHAIQHQARSA